MIEYMTTGNINVGYLYSISPVQTCGREYKERGRTARNALPINTFTNRNIAETAAAEELYCP